MMPVGNQWENRHPDLNEAAQVRADFTAFRARLVLAPMELAFDPKKAVARLRRVDPLLRDVIKQSGPFTHRPQKMQSPFQALFRAIVYQQLSGKAAATIMGRVMANYPPRGFKPAAVLAMPDEVFRTAGMSRAKVLSVKDLAAKTIDGTVPGLARLVKMDDEEIVTRLIQVRGIGVWTVEMLLIFRLGRPDVLPVADLGVRKGFMLTYGLRELPGSQEMLDHGERWRPFRSVASWYMWRAVELARGAEADGKLILPE
jgi:DNA-3-methyladenine glycosylase II